MRTKPHTTGSSPAPIRRRPAGCLLGVVIAGALTLAHAAPASAAVSGVPTPSISFDGAVDALAQSQNNLYIGGIFRLAGPTTGPGAVLDPTTGAFKQGMPMVSGGVYGNSPAVFASAPDGHGGWYIGGSFTHVGGVPRTNLAHILADGSVDPNWDPGPTESTPDPLDPPAVYAITVGNGVVYVGGHFDTIGGNRVRRMSLAALDPATGDPTFWLPDPGGHVNSIAIARSGTVYVAGDLGPIGYPPHRESRSLVAAIDPTTGYPTPFNPDIEYPGLPVGDYPSVFSLAFSPDGNTLYIAGYFSQVDGVARSDLAAVESTTGSLIASWNPNPSGSTTGCETRWDVASVATGSDGTVYAAGWFTSIGNASRTALAALDRTTGQASSTWNPNPSGDAWNILGSCTIVYGVTPSSNGGVYAAGNFTNIGGQPRNFLAAIDANGNAVSGWDASANNPAYSVTADPTTGSLYAGGVFTALKVQKHEGLAAINTTTGKLENFTANINDGTQVWALAAAPSGSPVYAAGTFDSITASDGTKYSRVGLAALDSSTGTPTSWNPTPNTPSFALTEDRTGDLYVGGAFTQFGSGTTLTLRNGLAKFDPNGNLTSWNPNAQSASVGGLAEFGGLALSPDDSTLYVGGSFKGIGAQLVQPSLTDLAALDTTTGNANASWAPNPDGGVGSIALAPPGSPQAGTVYAMGEFTHIGGQARTNLAALQPPTGSSPGVATAWNPSPSPSATSFGGTGLAVGSDGTVYAAGPFRAIGPAGTASSGVVSLDPTTAAVGLNPALDPAPLGLGTATLLDPNDTLYVGGGFFGGQLSPQSGFAAFRPAPATPTNTAAPQVSGTPGVGNTLTCSPGSWSWPSGAVFSYLSYQWLRDGQPIPDSARSFYTLQDADAGHQLSCQVTAVNDGGQTTAGSGSWVSFPASSFTFSPAAPAPGQPVSLDASASSDPAGVASYRWDFGDGTGASGPSPTVTHSYSQLGNYTVTLTVTNSKGYTGTSQQWFSVTGPLHADFTFSPASPQPGQPVSFYDGSSDPEAMIASYSWSFGDGSTGSGPMPQHAYAQPGAYTTSLTVTDAYGRTDSVSHTVTVKPAQTSGGGGNGGSGGSGSGGTGGGLPPPPSGGSGGTQPPPTSGGDGTGGSGGGGGSSSSPTLALSLTQAHQLHRVWREPSVRASRSAKAGPPVGTEFWFVLNEQAHVSFAFTREAPGRVLGGRCQSPRHPSRHARACLRDIREGTLEMPGRAGPNNLLFLGQVSRSRWLPPGQYTLALTATNSAGEKSGRLLLRFRIAP